LDNDRYYLRYSRCALPLNPVKPVCLINQFVIFPSHAYS